jgi:hypothetical protein
VVNQVDQTGGGLGVLDLLSYYSTTLTLFALFYVLPAYVAVRYVRSRWYYVQPPQVPVKTKPKRKRKRKVAVL